MIFGAVMVDMAIGSELPFWVRDILCDIALVPLAVLIMRPVMAVRVAVQSSLRSSIEMRW